MKTILEQQILQATGAKSISRIELVQSLWSNFGALERVWLKDAERKSIVIKRIQPPSEIKHPRGWNTDASSERKLRSYEIERFWYEQTSRNLPSEIKVPKFFFFLEEAGESVLGMEDLLESGFNSSFRFNTSSFDRCLEWLAKFHAYYMNTTPDGLWPIGTYWHLDTRKDEFQQMPSGALKNAAKTIDIKLNECKFQTLVHGDAKPANFCFTEDTQRVAAVDFQYVGGGCGMKDVIYLMSSALSSDELFRENQNILNNYFLILEKSLQKYGKKSIDFYALKQEWLDHYNLAWADFNRFLKGWNPGSTRLDSFMEARTNEALRGLDEIHS